MSSEQPQQYALALRLYKSLYRIRWIENEIARLYPSDAIKSPVHLSTGQESVSVGVCDVLEKTDIVFGTYRGHALYLAKGGDLNAMMAELFGKLDGCAKGKGGSMHLIDPSVGVMGTSAVVATSISEAVGYAFAIDYQETDQVVACFFGDGALGQGIIYEVMNMSSLWKLPVIYVCENNLYTEYTHYTETTAGNIIGRAKAFHVHAEEIDGQDIREVFSTTRKLVEKARFGDGPSFLLCKTYRYYGHHVGDINRTYYRSKEEENEWKINRDPLKIFANWMINDKLIDAPGLEQIESEVQSEMEDSVQFALDAPYPDLNEVDKHVYA